MKQLIVTEKPSVAKDLANCLGSFDKKDGYYESGDKIITFAFGHLVGLAEPEAMDPAWEKWSMSTLPMLPKKWKLEVLEQHEAQFDLIASWMKDPTIGEVVCATDAGREGELIFRLIYEKSGCKKIVKRLWLSSLTSKEILRSYHNLKSSSFYDTLADSALSRAKADWLLGLNLSRLYSLKTGQGIGIGRVQTPTLKMIVDQDQKIASFDQKEFLKLTAEALTKNKQTLPLTCISMEENPPVDWQKAKALTFELSKTKDLEPIALELNKQKAAILEVHKNSTKQHPPLFYDLATLQHDANKLYQFTAQQTLQIAQDLYEKRKAISYPRTDSRHLTEDMFASVSPVLKALSQSYESSLVNPIEGPLSSFYINAAKVTDHHGIIPVQAEPSLKNSEEEKIFDLIARRSLMPWQPDHSFETIKYLVHAVTSTSKKSFYFLSTMKNMLEIGWRKLDLFFKDEEKLSHKIINKKESLNLFDPKLSKEKTYPPPHLTDGSLLSKMVHAGKEISDKDLAHLLSDKGIGTPATRAQIIESLIDKQLVSRNKNHLLSTQKGKDLIEMVEEDIKNVELTAKWEMHLKSIEEGKQSADQFIKEIESFVSSLISKIKHTNEVKKSSLTLEETLKKVFKHDVFRSSQKEICEWVSEGKHALCVMATGSGKSLCYQLPALQRQSCALVISPLIALMQDQVEKLTSLGLKAVYLHAGLSREESRSICIDYLNNRLDFLFATPERLALSGFQEFLAKKVPSLIAIDEAHCISHWGHDFRSDYRQMGKFLKLFPSVPVIALTATATKQVQEDIIEQLDLRDCKSFICGFERDNIGIEVLETSQDERLDLIQDLLARKESRPAIIYAGTRKFCESLEKKLSKFRAHVRVYHAGLSPQERKSSQEFFQSSEHPIIIATIAFGMGIDKKNVRTVIHASLPSSIENYYQEIGRAGRDSKLSKAFLLFTKQDISLSEFLFELSYPEVLSIHKALSSIPSKGVPIDSFLLDIEENKRSGFAHQLKLHNCISITDERVYKNPSYDLKPYESQRNLREKAFQKMLDFALSYDSNSCRMVSLVEHFGQKIKACGICDRCSEKEHLTIKKEPLDTHQMEVAAKVVDILSKESKLSNNQILEKIQRTNRHISAELTNQILSSLIRAGICQLEKVFFKKNQSNITYFATSLQTKYKRSVQKKDLNALFLPSAVVKITQKIVSDPPSTSYIDLFQKLQVWRLEEAKRRHIPAFRIFSNKALETLAKKPPRDHKELEKIEDIPASSLKLYGEKIIELLH